MYIYIYIYITNIVLKIRKMHKNKISSIISLSFESSMIFHLVSQFLDIYWLPQNKLMSCHKKAHVMSWTTHIANNN